MRRSATVAVKTSVTALLLWVIWRQLDLGLVGEHLRSLESLWLPLIFASTVALVLADGLTLRAAMRSKGFALPMRNACLYSIVGWFFGNVAPSTIGTDVFRIAQLARTGASVPSALRVVLSARLMSSLGLVALLLVGLPIALAIVNDAVGRLACAAITVASLAGTGALLFAAPVLNALPKRSGARVIERLASASADLHQLALGARTRQLAWLSAVAQHAARLLTLFGISGAFGLDISWVVLLALAPTALLIAMVPISLASWGVRETAFVIILGLAGTEPEAALALSIALGLWRLSVGILAGGVWLVSDAGAYRFAPASTARATLRPRSGEKG